MGKMFSKFFKSGCLWAENNEVSGTQCTCKGTIVICNLQCGIYFWRKLC